jgi:lysine-N-methylase
MYTQDGETKFKMMSNGDCPFLNREHLCDIYTCLGSEHLCPTCAIFPRYINQFGAHREIGLSLSCPEAVRIIMSRTQPVSYFETKTDEKLTQCNDIDPAKYMCLKSSRKHLLNILQDRSQGINTRLAQALDYTLYIEKMMRRKAYGKIDFSYRPEEEKFSSAKVGRKKVLKVINAWFSHLEKMEFLRPGWKNRLCAGAEDALLPCPGFEAELDAAESEFEQIAVYYVARYFLRSVYSGSPTHCVSGAILCILICRELMRSSFFHSRHGSEMRWEIYRLYSKEIEHCQENMDMLTSLFAGRRCFSVKSLKSVLFYNV